MDSATLLAIALAQGYEVHALTIDYGQRHVIEIKRARRIARTYGAKSHLVLSVDLTGIGGSSLTDDIPVPRRRRPKSRTIPSTYVPARNTIFLSIALALAERINARDIFFGANVVDFSGYPDCSPSFIKAFEILARIGTREGALGKARFKIRSPLLYLTKAQIIKKGLSLGVDYGMTHSCYDPGPRGRPCGICDSCRLRLKGFRDAGLRDPLHYASRP